MSKMSPWAMARLPRERVREIMPSREEVNRVHERTNTVMFHAPDHGCHGVCPMRADVYVMLRFHPLNIRLPWVTFAIGSVVEIN